MHYSSTSINKNHFSGWTELLSSRFSILYLQKKVCIYKILRHKCDGEGGGPTIKRFKTYDWKTTNRTIKSYFHILTVQLIIFETPTQRTLQKQRRPKNIDPSNKKKPTSICCYQPNLLQALWEPPVKRRARAEGRADQVCTVKYINHW